MTLAPEKLKPPVFDKNFISGLMSEGRTPLVMRAELSIVFNEGYSTSDEAQVLIPGSKDEDPQSHTISLEVARQITEIQRELLLQ